jgi:hypothetical protein
VLEQGIVHEKIVQEEEVRKISAQGLQGRSPVRQGKKAV